MLFSKSDGNWESIVHSGSQKSLGTFVKIVQYLFAKIDNALGTQQVSNFNVPVQIKCTAPLQIQFTVPLQIQFDSSTC